MIDADRLADALVYDDPEVAEAVARAGRQLAAWLTFPRSARVAYAGEARRIARRAAEAVVDLVDAVDRVSTPGVRKNERTRH